MIYMLDTDISSYLIKGVSQKLREKIQDINPSALCISVITRAELLYGLKALPKDNRLHLAVKNFLKIVPNLLWDPESADHYADIRHHLTRKGKPIGEMDMMIAAHALSVGSILITNNEKHYKHVPSLVIENWA